MVTKKRKQTSLCNRVRTTNDLSRSAADLIDERIIGKEETENCGGIHPLTTYGVTILLLAIVSGLILNNGNKFMTRNENCVLINGNLAVDFSFNAFWNKICDENDSRFRTHAFCGNERVELTRRTLQAATSNIKPILGGDVVAEIRREFQIWEIDALRSDLVQNEKLFTARHKMTENPLAGGAFLATYLASERRRLLDNEKEKNNHDEQGGELTGSSATNEEGIDEVRASYFQALPSWEELSTRHPILKSRQELQTLLGHHSWNFAVAVMYQEMIISEYEALVTASPEVFARQISIKEYQIARIHVLSRSFNPGVNACSTEAHKYFSTNDLVRLQFDWGIKPSERNFKQGCHAMVPILDMLNSHPHPNVIYNYDMGKQAFVISAKSSISAQWELINSYGKYSDAHLFAKFGFVNGDGSGYTQASIALFHRPLDIGMSQEYTLVPNTIMNSKSSQSESLTPMEKIPDFQRINLKRYLLYDDGYENCVQKHLYPEAFQLKRLKWLHLANIANKPTSWICSLYPRIPESRPRKSSDLIITKVPPEFDPQKIRMDITSLVDTCRLLALTTYDFKGNAIKLLEENLGNISFVVPKGNQALEYRSLMFLARMATTALMQYPVDLKKEFDNVLQLNKENAFGNITWTASHLRLGEMQSLHALSGFAMSYARGVLNDAKNEESTFAYKIREKSCPQGYTDILNE